MKTLFRTCRQVCKQVRFRFGQVRTTAMRIGFGISFILICSLCGSLPVSGAENAVDKIMPVPSCAEGWTLDGKVTIFDKDTLFDRINGESELFFPYGFERLAYARYENKQNPAIALDADVYTMGSLLDAFGMFANYRRKDDADIAIGAQGTISSSQVFFYQDRFFVRLQVTGATNMSRDVFLACAGAISQNLPRSTGRPGNSTYSTRPVCGRRVSGMLLKVCWDMIFFVGVLLPMRF